MLTTTLTLIAFGLLASARPRRCNVKSSTSLLDPSPHSSTSRYRPISVDGTQTASSTVSVSSATSSPAPTSSAIVTNLTPADCKCGYILSAYSNAYFPLAYYSDFGSLPAGKVTVDGLKKVGWIPTIDKGAGGAAADGTAPIGSLDTISSSDGALRLTVPGGQKKGTKVKVAEITFDAPDGLTGGVLSVEAQLDATPGTCQAIFTYHEKDAELGDEQDIEMLGYALFEEGKNGIKPGIQLNNWNPNGKGNEGTSIPFPNDPTQGFNNYTIAWLPNNTTYYYNEATLNSPKKYSSVNPSKLYINHWTNGDKGWTQGPPTEDVIMRVKSTTLHYQTAGQEGLPKGCAREQACVV